MAPMPAEASPVSAHGSGTVTAVDMAAGTVSIDHGAIPEANWPPMLMTFKASPGLLTGISVGDHVEFDVRIQGGASEVTALRKK
ncbi:MAG: copper-binding protein [Caulobacteraceae bacterium]